MPSHEEMIPLTVGTEYEGATDIDLCRMADREDPSVLASLFGLGIVPKTGASGRTRPITIRDDSGMAEQFAD